MTIRYANKTDYGLLRKHDRHVKDDMLKKKIDDQTILVIYEDDVFIGWLRFNFFWDEHPFMNMLYLLEDYRGKGYGKKLVGFWEEQMLKQGYELLLLSTMSNEDAQHFYRQLGYEDMGGFIIQGEPLELMMIKELGRQEE